MVVSACLLKTLNLRIEEYGNAGGTCYGVRGDCFHLNFSSLQFSMIAEPELMLQESSVEVDSQFAETVSLVMDRLSRLEPCFVLPSQASWKERRGGFRAQAEKERLVDKERSII